MTGNFTDSNGSSASSHPVNIGRTTMTNGKTTLQQRITPRALRFSQKLVNASKKSPLARYPMTTSTPSLSMSPSMEPYLDDESLTDHHSCFSSSSSSSNCHSPQYQRDDQELNRHLQDLMLSPLRSAELTPTTDSPLSIPIGNQWRIHREKRPEVHQRGSDSPSLSIKPKRRKLKQQRTTAWRIGADVTLDTKKVHHQNETPVKWMEQQPQPVDQATFRRSTRIAGRKQRMQPDVKGDSYMQHLETSTKKLKTPPVILGVPSGVKPSQANDSILLSDDDDYNSLGIQQRSRRRRPRVDIVEERLDKLMSAHDPLDLSHHSVIPKNYQGTPPPIVIVLDEEEDEFCTDVRSEPNDNHQHVSSSHPIIIDRIELDENMDPTVGATPSIYDPQDNRSNQMDSPATPTSRQPVAYQSPTESPSTYAHMSFSLIPKNDNELLETVDINKPSMSLKTPPPSSLTPPASLATSAQPNQSTSSPNDQPITDTSLPSSDVPPAEHDPEIPQSGRTDDATGSPKHNIPAHEDGNLPNSADTSLLSRLFGPVAHYLVG